MAAEDCIVCIEKLATGDPLSDCQEPAVVAASPDNENPRANVTAAGLHSPHDATTTEPNPHNHTPACKDKQLIAFLPSCNHYLHDACLKLWTRRANSCPVCRKAFNVVEVKETLKGPVVDSYTVQDKKQEVYFDYSAALEPDNTQYFDDTTGNGVFDCMVCGELGSEDNLLTCHGCDSCWHPHCAGEETMPAGRWFCHMCQEDGTARSSHRQHARSDFIRTLGRARRHTRSQAATSRRQRRSRSQSPYGALRSTLSRSMNFNLDNPFDEDGADGAGEDYSDSLLQQRQRIADGQGPALAIREYLPHNRARTPTPAPEAPEESREWAVFNLGPVHNTTLTQSAAARFKRRSPSASPSEAQQPEREYKRAKTGPLVLPSHPASSSSSAGPSGAHPPGAAAANPTSNSINPVESGESFFQNLLAEVQQSTILNNRQDYPSILIPTQTGLDAAIHVSQSPVSSPAASSHSSPRHLSPSPPPSHSSRPGSPTPLSSTIEPAYAMRSNPRQSFSPISPRYQSQHALSRGTMQPAARSSFSQTSSARRQAPSGPAASHAQTGAGEAHARPSARSMESSSGRCLPLKTKEEIQNLVVAALKPAFNNKEIDAAQYTSINRQVSRRLYSCAEVIDGIKPESRKELEGLAVAYVAEALKSVIRPASNPHRATSISA